jgi:hypothetical protein
MAYRAYLEVQAYSQWSKTELAGNEFIMQHGVHGILITELWRYGRTRLEA